MAFARRKLQRRRGERRYRKIFIIATEGAETEPLYFRMFNYQEAAIHVRCLRDRHGSSPAKVLKRMIQHINNLELKKTDEAWLVVDKDQWSDLQLSELHSWSLGNENYGLAVSNPKFEYWLLLHFEDGNNISSSQDCSAHLRRYLPNYEKSHVEKDKLEPKILDAISRARQKDTPPCSDWPRSNGTTVYKLVEKLLNTAD